MTYWIEYWDINGKRPKKSKRENSHTDDISKVRRKLIRALHPETAGAVFRSKDADMPMGIMFFSEPDMAYIWSIRNPKTLETKNYFADANGGIRGI